MPLSDELRGDAPPLYLIDGSSFLYRAFYAFPDLKRSDGFPTNALFILARMLLKLLREQKPRFALLLLDGRGPTFRSAIYPAYKAQRPAAPEQLSAQIPPLLELCRLLGLPTRVADGVEADDCIASLAAAHKRERSVVIVGSDKDLRQCLDRDVLLWDPGLKTEKLTTLETFSRETGLAPDQWPDYQALIGDSSDNIPGIPGVGPKTALTLMEHYPTLEALAENVHCLTPAQQKKVAPHIEQVFDYRRLTRLRTDVCPEVSLDDLRCAPPDTSGLLDFFTEYEFRSLARELAESGNDSESPEPSAPTVRPRGRLLVPPAFPGKTVALCPEKGAWVLACEGKEYAWSGEAAPLVQALGRSGALVAPSLKDILQRLPQVREIPVRNWFDLSLAAYLLDPEERGYELDHLLRRNRSMLKSGPENPALAALELRDLLAKRLADAGLSDLPDRLELPLVPVLVDMEQTGVRIDLDAFAAFLDEVRNRLDELAAAIEKHAGRAVNIRSSRQLGDLLFTELGVSSRRKTPGGSPSTANEVLEALRDEHPLIPLILEFRVLEKLRSTYLDPLPRMTDENQRLHTTFNQTSTATGRLSSSNPNVQNIPIRGAFGSRMRSCFVAAPGRLLVAADYSQIELRVLAHFSRDQTLLDAFSRNEDVHASTAAILFDVAVDRITPEERRKAKTINFGLLYGMGPQKLSRELSISLAEAKGFMHHYFERLQGVKRFHEHTAEQARSLGCVTTLLGRRRLLPDINSRNANLAQQARRMAVNTVIQGSAADLIKLAMIEVHGDEELHRADARLILQVHDELLLEAPAGAASEAGRRLARIMRSVYPLCVPLNVDWGVGENWDQAH